MKLQCANPTVANQTMQFPVIGTVTFNKDAVIDIDDSLVESFLAINCGFSFSELGAKGKKETKSKDNAIDNLSAEKAAYEAGLNDLHINEINALIQVYPELETKSLKRKTEKVAYLLKKQYPA